MKSLDHIIRQLSFDINIKGSTSTSSLQESITNYCANNFEKDLEKQLKHYRNEHTKIDRIALDLGTISAIDWEMRLREKLENALQKQLVALFHSKTDNLKKSNNYKEKEDHTQPLLHKKQMVETLKRPETRYKHSSQVIFKAFCFFLEKGYLPWWYSANVSNAIEHLCNYKLNPDEIAPLIKLLKSNAKTLIRFLNTVPENKIASILYLKGTKKNIANKEIAIHNALLHSIAPSLDKKIFRHMFWKTLVTHFETVQPIQSKAITHFLIAFLSQEHLQRNIASKAAEKKIFSRFTKSIQNLWPKANIDIILIKRTLNVLNDDSKNEAIANSNTTSSKLLNNITSETNNGLQTIKQHDHFNTTPLTSKMLSLKENKGVSESRKKEEQEGVFVVNAGIILVHPLLPVFFTNLNLLKNGQWVNTEAQTKAVHLLAYLCTGFKSYKEENCLLFKQLCGLEWEALIYLDQELSTIEQDECKALLKAVLKHWKALKNTSIDGLREGFIQRSGKLYRDDTGWQLHIEQKAQDILLEHLPWGLGIIKLPWVDWLLRITWM